MGPYFDVAASKNVTALLGKTAYLNCRVKNLGNKTVSPPPPSRSLVFFSLIKFPLNCTYCKGSAPASPERQTNRQHAKILHPSRDDVWGKNLDSNSFPFHCSLFFANKEATYRLTEKGNSQKKFQPSALNQAVACALCKMMVPSVHFVHAGGLNRARSRSIACTVDVHEQIEFSFSLRNASVGTGCF